MTKTFVGTLCFATAVACSAGTDEGVWRELDGPSADAVGVEPAVGNQELSLQSDGRQAARRYLSPKRRGPFTVGSKTIFVRDQARPFDPWNAVYGSERYRELLETLDEVGESRSLVTEVWYPAWRPWCWSHRCFPEGVRRATYLDYYLGERGIFERRGVVPFLLSDAGVPVGELSLTDPEAHAQLVSDVLDRLARRRRGSFIGATARRGPFPLIVLSHGGFTGELGNNSHREVWTSEAENLASHGYVVVAMNHTGDSRHPVVFNDPDSRFAQNAGAQAIDDAYDTLFSEPGIPDKILGRLFDPASGATAVNEMMAQLFQMRVDDVATVIDGITELNDGDGFLAGRVDMERIGLGGFSLGSITTQAALGSLDQIDTGISWNNGMPHAWEPESFRGLHKPHLFSLGTEDELTRNFFSLLPFLAYPNTVPGGTPADILQLPGERFFPPDREIPEPVVRTAFERATGPKLLLEFIDMRHWDVTDSEDYLYPIRRLNSGRARVGFNNIQQHLPFGAEVLDPEFVGEPFAILGWERAGHFRRFKYLPHRIRNYYSVAWFGLHLKGIERYRNDLLADPFGGRTRAFIEEL